MTTVNGVILHSDGTVDQQVVDTSEIGTILGGWLEGIRPHATPHGDWFGYCDEEGKLKRLPVNVAATELVIEMGWHGGDVLCGTVVLVGPPNSQGDETDLPPETLQHVLDFYAE